MSEFVSTCPKCRQRILCDTQYVGKRVCCPLCAQEILMPEPPRDTQPGASAPAPAAQTPATEGGKAVPVGTVAVGAVVLLAVLGGGIWALQQHRSSAATPVVTPPPVAVAPATPVAPPAVMTVAPVAPVAPVTQATPRSSGQWAAQDVGLVNEAGSGDFNNGTFTINGSGDDIAGYGDAFQYMYQKVTADNCEIRAYVKDLKNTNPWAKAGVMIRESFATNSPFAMVAVTPEKGMYFERRCVTGQWHTSTSLPDLTPPAWIRVVRNGSTCSGYYSTNGLSWRLIDSDTINLNNDVQVGLAVTSHDNTKLCTASFQNVQIKP